MSGSSPQPLISASASPTAFTSADEEDSPDATGRSEATTPSKPRTIAYRRASSCAGALT